MVDSRNFKKQNQKGQGLKKHKWIPLVVIVVLALVLILIPVSYTHLTLPTIA